MAGCPAGGWERIGGQRRKRGDKRLHLLQGHHAFHRDLFLNSQEFFGRDRNLLLKIIRLNDGAGHFSPHPTTPEFGAGSSREIALGDLDGDGDLDAMLAMLNGEPQTVWLNDGAGNMTARYSFGAGSSIGLALGDLDGDGDLDAVVGENSALSTTVWLNGGYRVMLPIVLTAPTGTAMP